MSIDTNQLQPLERWLQQQAEDTNLFPIGTGNHFLRYWQIKSYCKELVYPYIGAATSAEDGGIYTDHSINHFNAVIKYAGALLGLETQPPTVKITPYEAFILLVSILLHDAGNILGRKKHEEKPLFIFKKMGDALCPDQFEARTIAKIAEVHGGKFIHPNGEESKDTIRNSNLDEESSYQAISYRPRLIAAIVRFADEICEDRSRAARFLLDTQELPNQSVVYHSYANSISSVDVDLQSKCINIKFELSINDTLTKKGKDAGSQYLIDEINLRLEKMFCELCYCRAFMYEVTPIKDIKATVLIHNETDTVEKKVFQLSEDGYPSKMFSFKHSHPSWDGAKVKKAIKKKCKNA